MYIPLMIGTEVSYNSGIPTSKENPASGVQADGNGNMSPALMISYHRIPSSLEGQRMMFPEPLEVT